MTRAAKRRKPKVRSSVHVRKKKISVALSALAFIALILGTGPALPGPTYVLLTPSRTAQCEQCPRRGLTGYDIAYFDGTTQLIVSGRPIKTLR